VILTPHSHFLDSDIVVVMIGAGKKLYTLHTKLLAYQSGYFQRRLIEQPVFIDLHMDDVTAEMFDVFVDWIYEERLPCISKDGDNGYLKLHSYILAERLSANRMKIALMDVIYEDLQTDCFTSGAIIYVFEHLLDDDPVLQLAVDAFCINNGVQGMRVEEFAEVDQLPKEFLVRLLRKLHQLSKLSEDEKKLKREDYNMVICTESKTETADE
jgi:hypothetical protein